MFSLRFCGCLRGSLFHVDAVVDAMRWAGRRRSVLLLKEKVLPQQFTVYSSFVSVRSIGCVYALAYARVLFFRDCCAVLGWVGLGWVGLDWDVMSESLRVHVSMCGVWLRVCEIVDNLPTVRDSIV